MRTAASLTTWFATVCVWLCSVHPASAQDRTYNAPEYWDGRLDWCLGLGKDCGQPAAKAYCNWRRFEDVVVFRAEVVGKSAATRTIGTKETCSNHVGCTAFAYITCSKRIHPSRVFKNPVWESKRLDVCLQWATNCGKPAADAFCKAKGFSEALHADPDFQPGNSSTKVISSGRVCEGPRCRGFQQIVCK